MIRKPLLRIGNWLSKTLKRISWLEGSRNVSVKTARKSRKNLLTSTRKRSIVWRHRFMSWTQNSKVRRARTRNLSEKWNLLSILLKKSITAWPKRSTMKNWWRIRLRKRMREKERSNWRSRDSWKSWMIFSFDFRFSLIRNENIYLFN